MDPSASTTIPPLGRFPWATQPQIIRANQKDFFHLATLRDQVDNTLRSWLGTRWLARWAAEVEVVTQLTYIMLTSVRNVQSLGEEYVDIWQYSVNAQRMPSTLLRTLFALCMTLPRYLLSVARRRVSPEGSMSPLLRMAPQAIEIIAEINLAAFYLHGTYHDVTRRLFRMRHISSIPENPNNPPPSYSLLGILLCMRLLHRLYTLLKAWAQPPSEIVQSRTAPSGELGPSQVIQQENHEPYIDSLRISEVVSLAKKIESGTENSDAESDKHTMLQVADIEISLRAGRKCPLCLEERTGSTATECGHVFCWTCVMGWGREKPECPLCRQPLILNKLIPLYNI